MMIIILIIVAVLMLIYGLLYSNDYTDSIVIAVVVLINAIMGFIQEEKAEVTLEGLKKYVSSTCKVKRNGKLEVIDTKLLVPGDYIILEAGEKVPADARIVSLSNLLVDESPLTGESNPVSKRANKINGTKLQIQDQLNMLFSGTNITNGRAEAIVTATGMYTELGKIAVSLNTPYEVKTPLELRIEEISKKLTFLVFLILIFIFIYSFIQKYEVMEIIMLCSSLAVAVIPEGLPAVITISLSNGAGALAKKKTIVRQMTAVETLGSTDVICSDKTGTITQNKMNVQKNIVLNQDWLDYVKILCNDAMYSKGKFVGDPTETCMLEELGYKKVSTIANDCPRLIDVPFDSDRKMMSTVNVIKGKTYLLVKGSLDSLMKKCSYMYKDNKKIKLTKEMQRVINEEEANMAENALRVISFAYKELKKVPKNIDEILKEEENLVLVGLSGMIDPPRVGVKESVLQAKNAGVRTIMITGDSLITAGAIAKRVGIVESRDECLLGSKLDEYTDEELIDVVNKYSVYARVSPIHKERIVKALQAQGKVVAMTGDGVNDAPAIKDAHVGIGMGITGTEVVKKVADCILVDDSFSTIVDGVEEGRRITSNIKKVILSPLLTNAVQRVKSGISILLKKSFICWKAGFIRKFLNLYLILNPFMHKL
jgi:Ca2+-transporting ATPase